MPKAKMITSAGHRVIGIRHTLRQFKKKGLIDEDDLYPREAVEDVQDRLEETAVRWYKKGCRRGAIVALEQILKSSIVVEKDGKRLSLSTDLSEIKWPIKTVKIRIGNKLRKVSLQGFALDIEDDLDFE